MKLIIKLNCIVTQDKIIPVNYVMCKNTQWHNISLKEVAKEP